MSRKVVAALALAGLLATVWIGQALAQEGKPERQAGERRAQQRRRWDPEQMRRRSLERIRETLEATDEEWQVLEPGIEKVQSLSRQARGTRGMRMLFMRRRAPEGAEPTREMSEVDKKAQELMAVLDNVDAKPEEIKAKLAALREVQEKARQELAKAQEALREAVNLRQEARLVLIGLLD